MKNIFTDKNKGGLCARPDLLDAGGVKNKKNDSTSFKTDAGNLRDEYVFKCQLPDTYGTFVLASRPPIGKIEAGIIRRATKKERIAAGFSNSAYSIVFNRSTGEALAFVFTKAAFKSAGTTVSEAAE